MFRTYISCKSHLSSDVDSLKIQRLEIDFTIKQQYETTTAWYETNFCKTYHDLCRNQIYIYSIYDLEGENIKIFRR